MIRTSPSRVYAMVFVMAVVALLTLSSCSQSSSGNSDDADSSPTVLTGTWVSTQDSIAGSFVDTYVFTDTTYEISVTHNGDTQVSEKGTYSITDYKFTTNETYPLTKSTDWYYTLKTVDGKQVFTYDMYFVLTKQ